MNFDLTIVFEFGTYFIDANRLAVAAGVGGGGLGG
jgi:hypothetical protein